MSTYLTIKENAYVPYIIDPSSFVRKRTLWRIHTPGGVASPKEIWGRYDIPMTDANFKFRKWLISDPDFVFNYYVLKLFYRIFSNLAFNSLPLAVRNWTPSVRKSPPRRGMHSLFLSTSVLRMPFIEIRCFSEKNGFFWITRFFWKTRFFYWKTRFLKNVSEKPELSIEKPSFSILTKFN